MAYLYPWGNTQQLNLDWILQKIKELEAGSGGGGADLDEVATALISASYSVQAYDRSDIVFYDGKLYRANQAIPAPGEAWTPTHWDEILLGDTVSNLVQYVAALSNDQIVNNSTVSGTHTSDALNTLKNAIDGITVDSDSVSNESQVTGDSVSDALDTLKNAIDGITLDSDSVSNESQVTGDNVSDALDTLEGAISAEVTARGNADTAICEQISAYIETGNTASRAYTVGDFVIWKNKLYQVTANIANGGAFTVNTNISAATIGNELSALTTPEDVTLTYPEQTKYHFSESGGIIVTRLGKLVFVQVSGLVVDSPSNTNLAVVNGLPAPSALMYNKFFSATMTTYVEPLYYSINTSGAFRLRAGLANETYNGFFTYISA